MTLSSSSDAVDIPYGLLSSLPPNCSVYITHRPASGVGDQNSPPPITQIIINHAATQGPSSSSLSSTLLQSNTLHHRPAGSYSYTMPSLLPLQPSLPLSPPRLPPPPPPSTALVNHFHPLDDVRRLHEAATANVASTCRGSNMLAPATIVRPPRSLTTYATDFRHLEAVGASGVSGWKMEAGDVGRWKMETGSRRASDSVAALAASSSSMFTGGACERPVGIAVDRCRHHSSAFAGNVTSPTTSQLGVLPSVSQYIVSSPIAKTPPGDSVPLVAAVTSPVWVPTVAGAAVRPPTFSNRFQRPTSLSLPAPASVHQRPRCREPPSCQLDVPAAAVPWRRGSVESLPRTWLPADPLTPDTDGSLSGSGAGLPHCSGLEELNADCSSGSSSNGEGDEDGASCLLSSALQRFCASPDASSLLEDDNHADLSSPATGTSAKSHQRTIDALSKKIQRNRTRGKVDDKPLRCSKEALASSFARPDSSCPTPPLPSSRQVASSLSSSSASPDANEMSASSGPAQVLHLLFSTSWCLKFTLIFFLLLQLLPRFDLGAFVL